MVGKVAFVTGAGKGIGKAIAIAYAKQGIHIACIARTFADVERTAKEIGGLGGEAIAIACDVTRYEQLSAAMRQTFEQYGRIDVVVVNAGVACIKLPADQLPVEEWRRVIDTNLSGAFYTVKAAIPYLKRNGAGKIIAVGSGMGPKGMPESAPYCCSKAALWMLTRILAQELAEYKISVNELIPGPVVTEMDNATQEDKRSAFSIAGEWIKSP